MAMRPASRNFASRQALRGGRPASDTEGRLLSTLLLGFLILTGMTAQSAVWPKSVLAAGSTIDCGRMSDAHFHPTAAELQQAITACEAALKTQPAAPVVQTALARAYLLNGQYDRTRALAEQASAKEQAEALYLLGSLYSDGLGVSQDLDRGRDYFERAAGLGFAPALYVLGLFHEIGRGVPSSSSKAALYYQLAAAAGSAAASTRLGEWYVDGIGGTTRDLVHASAMFEAAIAADPHYAPAYLGVGSVAYRRTDYATASVYFNKAIAADPENARALRMLGHLYEYGEGVPVDYAQARQYYERSAEARDLSALVDLALLYRAGKGIAPDAPKARAFLELAAERGEIRAMRQLAELYRSGEGGRQNNQLADFWLKRADTYERK